MHNELAPHDTCVVFAPFCPQLAEGDSHRHSVLSRCRVDPEWWTICRVHVPTSRAAKADLIVCLDEFQLASSTVAHTTDQIILAGDMNRELPRAATTGREAATRRSNESYRRGDLIWDLFVGLKMRVARCSGEGHEKQEAMYFNKDRRRRYGWILSIVEEITEEPPPPWSRCDHRPVSASLPARERKLLLPKHRPQKTLKGWMPCKTSALALQRRWAGWRPSSAAEVQAELAEAAQEEPHRCDAAVREDPGRLPCEPLPAQEAKLVGLRRELQGWNPTRFRHRRERIGRAIWRLRRCGSRLEKRGAAGAESSLGVGLEG